MGRRADPSQPTGNRKESEERGSVGSYSTTTRSYDPETAPGSTEGREALVLFRTGRTGLASFLYWIGVPEFKSPVCRCGQEEETPYHVLRHRPLEEGNRQSLRTMCEGGIDVVRLLNTPEGAGVAARWIVQSGRLSQFRVAKALSYE